MTRPSDPARSCQRRLNGLQAAAEHLPQLRGVLVAVLADGVRCRFAEALTGLDAGRGDASAKLAAYADLYLQVLRNRRMCLCGMLAAEYQTLPEPMQGAVIRFFDQNETWLEGVLEQGREDGSLQFAGSARDTARMVVGGLEGAMLVARPYGDIARFQAAADNLLAGLAVSASMPLAAVADSATAQPA